MPATKCCSSATRRRAASIPSVNGDVSLREAIASERRLLEPITTAADLVIDTSNMGVHALRELVRERVDRRREGRLSLMFESFGYKHGIPGDADFVFDVRSLPNPYWEHALRHLNGRDAPVIEYLAGYASVRSMIADLIEFLERRVIEFAQANRSYLTIAVGCTGGQHRSVYIAEKLADHFRQAFPHVLTRHDSLQKSLRPARTGCLQRGVARYWRAFSRARKARISSARARASAYPRAINSRVKPRSKSR